MKPRKREQIVIVDEHDRVLGEEDKEKCHDGEGILHRAFLAMVFNRAGELLLARRSDQKRLWPGFWDGSAASHVFHGEDYVQASRRRLQEELGIVAENIEYAFKFQYKAGYRDLGTEHEICAVTIVRGVSFERIQPDPGEISAVRTADLKALIQEIRADGRQYTPWLVLALEHISERPMLEREAVHSAW
jgi:isopentenyl-diphosphate delta-isomerase